MTQVEFNKHYKDFIMHYDRKYKVMDLNFDQVMKMKGVNEDEFKQKIKYVNALNFNELNQVGEYQWVDEGYYRSSDGGKSQDYNVWVDEGDNGY